MSISLPTLPTVSEEQIATCLASILAIKSRSIDFLLSQGQMHSIIRLTFDHEELSNALAQRCVTLREAESRDSLTLRIAAKNVQHQKLENEAAVYVWLAQHTTIPTPQIIHHDSSDDNVLGHQFMLMTHMQGEDGAGLYKTFTDSQMEYVLNQLADHFVQLSRHPFNHIGGLSTRPDGSIGPGPVVDEVCWNEPDVAKYFPPGATATDINPSSLVGYPSYVAYLTAWMRRYLHAIRIHPALHSLRYLNSQNISLLEQFVDKINEAPLSEKLDDLPYILAHNDLHFGQFLLDPDSARITAVPDWEFAQVVLFPFWKKCFLWSGDMIISWSPSVTTERKKLRDRWKKRVRARDDGGEGSKALTAQKWKYEEQRVAWDVVNYVRCIVEVVPRNVQLHDAERWWKEIIKALRVFGLKGSETITR